MILEEANKVVKWEQTADLSRREGMRAAAEVQGQGGVIAAEAAVERSDLVQDMMMQKANLMLLSTVS